MSNDNQNSSGGGCFGFIVVIVIVAFFIRGCVSNSKDDTSKNTIEKQQNDSSKDVTKKQDDVIKNVTKKIQEKSNSITKKDSSEENQKKFIEAENKFYDMYIECFGNDFSIADEPFENGEYKGNNRKKYKKLAKVLDDMCMYYKGIKKKSDRYDTLGDLHLHMYDYIYNVRQMLMLIEDVNKYEDEEFILEYSDYIVY